jgi:UDP-glucose 4-epimerase
MYSKNTKILITGGAGFIGTNFINDLLIRGHNPNCIAVIDNLAHGTYLPNIHDKIINFFKEDIRNEYVKTIISNFKPDYIYHFAGLVSIYDCHKNPYEAVDNNILGSINILDAAADNNVKRIIFSETSAVYENCNMPHTGFNETQSDPTTIYSTTKACLALLAESYSRTKGVNYTALRYFNVAGPLQDYNRTVPPVFAGFIIRLIAGKNPIIFGDPLKARDYIDVDDINSFHMLCMENENTANQTFNLGTGKIVSLLDLKDIIGNVMGINDVSYDHYEPIVGEALNIQADISKAKSVGWAPKKSMNLTIKETFDYLTNEINNGNINPSTFMDNLKISENPKTLL